MILHLTYYTHKIYILCLTHCTTLWSSEEEAQLLEGSFVIKQTEQVHLAYYHDYTLHCTHKNVTKLLQHLSETLWRTFGPQVEYTEASAGLITTKAWLMLLIFPRCTSVTGVCHTFTLCNSNVEQVQKTFLISNLHVFLVISPETLSSNLSSLQSETTFPVVYFTWS